MNDSMLSRFASIGALEVNAAVIDPNGDIVEVNEAWKEFDDSSREVERKKDSLLDEISQRLNQEAEQEELFIVRWQLD